MPDGGCWIVAGQSRSRPAKYSAPSWSWAALDGPINMRDVERARAAALCCQLAEVWEADTTTVDANTTGQVTDGYIRLLVFLQKPDSMSRE